tara:strand:- start:16189 stop:18999 length:2811 start_codon:yes stop_codon:yes gene_type:complete
MTTQGIEHIDPKKNIVIKGAKMHNLKNVSVAIPRNHLVVITGLSGSGKSSLAFDTLYAEGQRRYVESLSSYARQFMGKLDKPEVEYIKGISPAIAIQQKVNTRNPRSTVGTTTEIYDYLKLLFARIGKTFSPISGEEVKSDTVTDVVQFLATQPENSKVMISAPFIVKEDTTLEEQAELLQQQGFNRILINNSPQRLDEWKPSNENIEDIELLIDRVVVKKDDEDNDSRIADSVQTAFYEGDGACNIHIVGDKKYEFSNRFELDGITFEKPTVHFFAFNNPVGACKRCEGFGSIIGIDPDLVIPNKSLSVYDDAVVCWKGEKMSEWKQELIMHAHKFDFPIHRAYYDLSAEEKELLWTGNKYFKGLNRFFKYLEENSYKIQYRVMLSRYRGKTLCPECKGTRLRKDANNVKVNRQSITNLVLMPVKELKPWFDQLDNHLSDYEKKVAKRLLIEIKNRLQYLADVGLDYLTLNRLSNTLSGGESQRINLATMLGSSLVGSMYILDEPSIGLHPRDTQRLISVLQNLKQLGNTVIVVEHEEEVMQAADQIIDLGPLAGSHGGELIFQGDHDDLITESESLTAKYLTGKVTIPIPEKRRKWKKSIDIFGARENNLKDIHVSFPLECLTVITGVSGSGKSSLVKTILYPALKKLSGNVTDATGNFDRLDGDFKAVEEIEFIDQNPIGKSSRSNPVTYVKAYDDIRALFASQQLAKMRGYKPATFSFNVEGGRCDNCQGEGIITVEMQFMADIHLECDVCKGKRFKSDVLEVTFKDQSIYDILSMTIDDAISFFSQHQDNKHCKKIIAKLQPLQDVGLGYVQLGQASSTLSGGEAQRIKLASFLTKGSNSAKTLFIFDEPTTGLHFHDIEKLLTSFYALIENGHSIIVIEHNTEVIKCADWVIDLGPEGGKEGGNLVFAGTPEELVNCKESYTGKFLKGKL